jgi:RNA-directed DNA polymerase
VNTNIYSQICNPANLWFAYVQISMQMTGAPFDQLSVSDYERHLELNLNDLAMRLGEDRYFPVSWRILESNGNSFPQTIRVIEDQIVQRAAFNAIAPLFEPAFLDCSFGSHRNREARMAVQQVLAHRARGDNYIVKADISDCFYDFDHDNLIYLIGTQINDQRLLRLIRMWLNCGQALPWAAKIEPRSLTHSSENLPLSINSAIEHLLEKIGSERWDDDDDWVFGDDRSPQEFKDALRRLGYDAARITLESSLLALASNPRYRHFFTKRNIIIAASAALGAAAYPAASQFLRERLLAEQSRQIPTPSRALSCLPDGPLVGLMTDVALHRFDVAMTGAEWRLVRYYDKFAITTPRESEAHFALEHAMQELRRMDIPLNPQKTRIARFEEGVEFLGYRIDEDENAAVLIETDEQSRFNHWWRQVSDVVRQAPAQLAPAATQIGGFTKNRLNAGFRQIKSLVHRNRDHGRETFRHGRK